MANKSQQRMSQPRRTQKPPTEEPPSGALASGPHPLAGADQDEEVHDLGKLSIRQLLMMRQFFTLGTFPEPDDKIAAGSVQKRIVSIIGAEPPPQQGPQG